MRSFGQQLRDEVNRGRETDVVRIGFESEAEHADLLFLDHPEGAANLLKKNVNAPPVHFFRFFQQREIHAGALRQMYERLQILGKAETAEADTGVEEAPADARVKTYG